MNDMYGHARSRNVGLKKRSKTEERTHDEG